MIYFDSAYVAKCYLREQGTDEVLDLAEASAGRTSLILAVVEVNAVFHRHFREGRLTLEQFQAVCLRFEQDQKNGYWNWLPLDDASARRTGRTFRHLPAGIFLRSLDCLHLMAASEAGFTEIYSNDRHLLAAAPHFDLRGVDIIGPL